MPTLTEQLVELIDRPISDADRARAKLLLIDWVGCSVAGRREPAGEKMAATFPEENGVCTRIGSSPASPLMAALHNGSLGNVLEMDDVDKRAVLHAAPTVIPAALAMAEYTHGSPRDFLDAIVKGYEVTIRIGRAVGPGHYAFWHNTATCGPFGAAISACHLLKGSDPVSALGLAGTQAAGLWQTRHEPDSMAKQLHAGHAAHAGVLAALLSAQSFQGPRTILEGEQGFFAAMCPGADAKKILADYGSEWLHHQTSIKPYPACRHAHPAIDAALQAELAAGEIVIETYADAIKFCDRPNPKSAIEAKFSLQHSVAVALSKPALQLSDFEPETLNEYTELRSRIQVKENSVFSAIYPAHYGAAVIIGGKKYVAKDAYGDPENPMSEEAIWQKASGLFNHANIADDKSDKFFQSMQEFEWARDLSGFTSSLS